MVPGVTVMVPTAHVQALTGWAPPAFRTSRSVPNRMSDAEVDSIMGMKTGATCLEPRASGSGAMKRQRPPSFSCDFDTRSSDVDDASVASKKRVVKDDYFVPPRPRSQQFHPHSAPQAAGFGALRRVQSGNAVSSFSAPGLQLTQGSPRQPAGALVTVPQSAAAGMPASAMVLGPGPFNGIDFSGNGMRVSSGGFNQKYLGFPGTSNIVANTIPMKKELTRQGGQAEEDTDMTCSDRRRKHKVGVELWFY